VCATGALAGERALPSSVVELARGGQRAKLTSNVVVGVDRSPVSMTALHKGAEIAALLGSGLRVVHAVDLSDYPVDPDGDDWEEQARSSLESERSAVSEALATYPGAWSFIVVRADPAVALAAASRRFEALMVVVGAHPGRWHRLGHMGGHSVAQRLVERCPCPVLVVGCPKPG
jgi:nucleotide-binding universal stress UspA family protein